MCLQRAELKHWLQLRNRAKGKITWIFDGETEIGLIFLKKNWLTNNRQPVSIQLFVIRTEESASVTVYHVLGVCGNPDFSFPRKSFRT